MVHHHPAIRLLAIIITVVTLTSNFSKANFQIHKQFHQEELKKVFQVTTVDKVPDYQLVRVRSLSRRSSGTDDNGDGSDTMHELHLSAFGQNFQLRLRKNEHLSRSTDRLRMFFAEGCQQDGCLNITELHSPEDNKDVGEIYQDTENGAAILLHRDKNGALLVDGTIGSSLVIKPLPERMRQVPSAPPDDQFFLDNELPPVVMSKNKSTLQHVDHVVIQRVLDLNDTHSDYMLMEPDRQIKSRRSIRSKREAPVAIWPEILVIVDYDTYNMHGGNNVDIKRYFISFWNGVDLRYKLLTGPKVRVSLAGIIISKGRDATPYLENNRVGGNAVDSAGALTELGKYLFRERRLPTYDIAVVITKLDICRRRTDGRCRRGTAGFAYVGGACVVNKRLEKVNSVAIIEDTGGFSGIIVAAHEVGHLLGAVHDGSPPPSYLGGPGAEHCRWEDGYIMSDLRHTERGFKWSVCSIQQFKHFLNGDTAKCLYNIPHEDEELPRLLPGKLLSLDSQCRKDRGTSACFKDDRVCAQLFCFDSRSGYCVSYRPAAEGSPCGDSQFCLNGRCVSELENIIPDYSSITETVIDKSGVQVTTGSDSESADPVNVVPYGPAAATKPSVPAVAIQRRSGSSDISGSNLDPAISDGVFDYFRA